MAVLEIIDRKLDELKPIGQDELNRMTNVLRIVNDAIKALNDDNKLIDYDFDIAINLVNQNVTNFGIIDLSKGIKDIKNVLIARKKFNLPDLAYSEEQRRVIISFKEKLNNYKKELENLISRHANDKQNKEIIENINDLKKLFDGKGRRKFYTYEMLESLFEVIDYDSLSYQDILELSELLKASKNKDNLDSEVSKEEVVELLKEYLGDKVKEGFITKHSKEICSTINLENARNILEFFKKENILNRFGFMGLMQILLKGRSEFISKFYYEEILPENENLKSIFFDDIMSCVWINEKSAGRRYTDGIRDTGEKQESSGLCGDLPEVSKADVIENIRLLKQYENILYSKYDLSNISELWVLTRPPWLLKKNLLLFREFCVYHVKPSAIAQNDLDSKINLAVELGLLNPPRNKAYKYIESTVPKNREYSINGEKKAYSDSILNYFRRNTSQLGNTSYSEYIYLFYRMQRCGKEEFYKTFFSDRRAGTRSREGFNTIEDKNTYGSANAMKKIVDENFANRFYSQIIENYSNYEKILKEFSKTAESTEVSPYFSPSILEEELVEKLEEYRSRDIIENGNKEEVHINAYAYVFGQTIVSRFKVLRNLTILKKRFGYINEDMILAAIAYKSYFSRDVFDTIKACLRKEMVR
jgi:hypothetical protein